jgi:hypothetical protein
MAATGSGTGGDGTGSRSRAASQTVISGSSPQPCSAQLVMMGSAASRLAPPVRVGRIRRTGPEFGSPLLVAHRYPGQPVRDRAAADLAGGQEH